MKTASALKLKHVPPEAKVMTRRELAYGEVTGHSHAIADQDTAFLVGNGDDLYMVVTESGEIVDRTAEIRHEEHAPHFILPGECQIIPQIENTYWGQQRVID